MDMKREDTILSGLSFSPIPPEETEETLPDLLKRYTTFGPAGVERLPEMSPLRIADFLEKIIERIRGEKRRLPRELERTIPGLPKLELEALSLARLRGGRLAEVRPVDGFVSGGGARIGRPVRLGWAVQDEGAMQPARGSPEYEDLRGRMDTRLGVGGSLFAGILSSRLAPVTRVLR